MITHKHSDFVFFGTLGGNFSYASLLVVEYGRIYSLSNVSKKKVLNTQRERCVEGSIRVELFVKLIVGRLEL